MTCGIAMTDPGGIVEVVLDAEELDDGSYRILLQGVFARGEPQPPPRDGCTRNVMQCFFGRDMRSVSAFRIWPTGG